MDPGAPSWGVLMLPKSQVALFMNSRCVLTWLTLTQHHMKAKTFFKLQICSTIKYYIIYTYVSYMVCILPYSPKFINFPQFCYTYISLDPVLLKLLAAGTKFCIFYSFCWKILDFYLILQLMYIIYIYVSSPVRGKVQGRSQDVSLRGVSVRLRRDVFGQRKTSRCNLAIEISFVPSSQSTFNFSVLRGTQVDFLIFNLLRPGPGAMRLGSQILLKITASRTHLRASGKTKC